MPTVKTTISIREPLYKESDRLAKKMALPRSRLYAIAIEQFIKSRQNQELFQTINKAYAKGLDRQEKLILKSMKGRQRKLAEGQWR